MECPTITDFKDFIKDYARKYGRYEYVNPLFNKKKKPQPYKSVYLKMGNSYNLFYIYEDTLIFALKDLANYLEDYLDGLYPELKAPFEFVPSPRGKLLEPRSLKRISGLYIVWIGKATNPDKGIY
jgi:hypothetical protein